MYDVFAWCFFPRCLEDLNEKDLELRKLQACIQQLQQECDQMQMQKDQAQQLLEEQEQNHTTTVEAFKEEVGLEEFLYWQLFATRGQWAPVYAKAHIQYFLWSVSGRGRVFQSLFMHKTVYE